MTDVANGQGGAPRVDATRVPGLDEMLGGGLPRGALTLVVGPPGSGKTTLATQLAFAAARSGRRVLILTAYSEPTAKLVGHLRGFTFFDEDLLGAQIQVLSLQQFLTQGLDAAAVEIIAEARRLRVSLVVLDGFRGIRAANSDPQEARAFLYEVGTALSVLGATTLITSEAEPRDTALFPESTVADVLIGIHYRLDDVRARRGIEAIKVRGAAPLPGLHSLTLNANGATIALRLEARVIAAAHASDDDHDDAPSLTGPTNTPIPFGLPELDAILGGGLTHATPTLVLGSPGTGKTLLGLHFALAGVAAGEPVVFLGFQETRAELLIKANAFDLGLRLRRALAPDGLFTLLRQPPVERDADILADELLAALDRTGARRLVVDTVSGLERTVRETSDRWREANYLGALVEALRTRGVTTLFLKGTDALVTADLSLRADLVSVMAANVLWLQQVTYRERLHRVLSAPKMRFSAHDTTLREFTIAAPEGLRVLAPVESANGVLVGIARSQVSDTGPIRMRDASASTVPTGGSPAPENL